MNIRPPMTIATSARERASGHVNVVERLLAARSHGDWASADAGSVRLIATAAGGVRPKEPHFERLLLLVLFCLRPFRSGRLLSATLASRDPEQQRGVGAGI